MQRRSFLGALLGLAASAVAAVLPKARKRHSVEAETVIYEKASAVNVTATGLAPRTADYRPKLLYNGKELGRFLSVASTKDENGNFLWTIESYAKP